MSHNSMHKIGTFLTDGNLPEGIWMVSSIGDFAATEWGYYYYLVGVSESNRGNRISRYEESNTSIKPDGRLGFAKVIKGHLHFVPST